MPHAIHPYTLLLRPAYYLHAAYELVVLAYRVPTVTSIVLLLDTVDIEDLNVWAKGHLFSWYHRDVLLFHFSLIDLFLNVQWGRIKCEV
jgi:hypothetical protein